MSEIIGFFGIVMFLVPFIILLIVYKAFLNILSVKSKRKYDLWAEISYLKFNEFFYLNFFPISFLLIDINKKDTNHELEDVYKLFQKKIGYEYIFWGIIFINLLLILLYSLIS